MGKRVKVLGECYWVDSPSTHTAHTHTRTSPPQPEPSTQIEMDFEVIRHTETLARKMSAVDYWSVLTREKKKKKLAPLNP